MPRTSFNSGCSPPASSTLPERLSNTHPFTQQVDILLHPPDSLLEQKLRQFESTYYEGQIELSEILDASYDLTGRYSLQNDFVALSEGQLGVEDAWCIDHRGLLTLALTKETYQQLGLLGEKLSKKSDVHYVQIDLYDKNSSSFSRAKEKIRSWDERRKAQGVRPWRVFVRGTLPSLTSKLTPRRTTPRCTILEDAFVPVLEITKNEFSLSKKNAGSIGSNGTKVQEGEEGEGEDDEERKERIEELFEWVGMACMSSDRLKANDRPNAFVAQYEAPAPCTTGSVTHLRWTGFFGPADVRRVLDAVVEAGFESLRSPSGSDGSVQGTRFVAITGNLFRQAPVTYISAQAFQEGAKDAARLGRSGRRDECWSLICKPYVKDEEVEMEWILATVGS